MDEFIKQRVLEGFEEGFRSAVDKVAQQNPSEWNNNPLYSSAMTLAALNETKNVYKQMLKNNSTAFDIRIFEVDSFIDSIGEKIRKKYFY
jgi:hypothetical protein